MMFSLYTEEKGIVGSDPEDSCKGDSSCGSSCFFVLAAKVVLLALRLPYISEKSGWVNADPC